MKVFLVYLLMSSLSYGADISFVGPCEKEPVYSGELNSLENESIGAFTVRFLDDHGLEYAGAERGMNSIFNTPTGMDAMEILSDSEMMAYGWCYSVNGFSPEVFPDQVKIADGDSVLWWFGYAHYIAGEWVTQCSLSYERHPDFLCHR